MEPIDAGERTASPAAAVLVSALFASIVVTQGGHEGHGGTHWAVAVFTGVIGVTVVPVARTLAARDVPALAVVAALASAGSGTIHLAVTETHFGEWWGFGVFFLCSGVIQLAWAALAVVEPTRLLLVVGAAGNALIIVVWVVSRTVGLPFGPDPGSTEAVGSADVAATLFEGLIVIACLLLLSGRAPTASASRATSAVLVVLAAAATAVGLAASPAEHESATQSGPAAVTSAPPAAR
jgi:hypothetical protein